MVPTTKLAMDGEAAEGRREGKRWKEPEQSHMNGADRSGMRASLTAKRWRIRRLLPVRNRARAGRRCINSGVTIDEDIDTDGR